MRMQRQLAIVALACAVSAGLFAAQQTTGKASTSRLTVGKFAAMLTGSRRQSPQPEASRSVESLVRSGVPLGDLSATLTEHKLAEIMNFYGIDARSSTSAAEVTKGKAEAALLLINSSAALPKQSDRPIPAGGPLDDCLAQPNHGQCTVCCKSLIGSEMSNTECSKFCMQINKPSSPEPIP
jgi:hypothetical protein